MARKKDAMALFEIISKLRDKRTEPKVAIPKWMLRRRTDEPAEETPPEDTAAETDVQEPSAPQPTQDESEAAEAPQPQPIVDAQLVPEAQEAEGGKKILVIEDRRVNLSLSYVGAGVAVTGVLVLLLGAFLAGRYSAPGGQTAAVGPGGGGPSSKKEAPGKGEGPHKGTPGKPVKGGKKPPAPAAVLQKGKFYLVIQHLMGSERDAREDGDKIVKFCGDNGCPAKIMRQRRSSGQYMYMVWSLKPFDNGDSTNPAALLHAEKIDELGKRYFRLHGKYKLTQREGGNIKLWLMKY